MARQLTNAMLRQLLRKLGFEEAEAAVKNCRVWRNPQSGCELLLPANKTQEAPRPADIVGIKHHLALHGHLEEEVFDFFVIEGRLPAGSSLQR